MCSDTVESLEVLGYSVSFPQAQTCCGIPARYSGEMDAAREMAKLNIDVLLKEEADFIVTICPTCTMSITHDFVKLLADDPLYAEKAQRLAAKTFNYSELAARKIKPGEGSGKENKQVVTYHDACHLKRGCGIHEEPRQVLRALANAEIREMTDCDKCCGFGGSYSIKYPEISQEVLKNKLANINETGVGILAVDCPGCKLQIEGGLEASGSKMRVEHTATLVRERMR
jgi:Fe-S oxidoreductase